MDDLRDQQTTISSLPVEIIENIFDNLPLASLKEASLVCRQWSHIAFYFRRMGRIRLKLDFDLYEPQDYVKLLQDSQRQYRNLLITFSNQNHDPNVCCAILRKFGEHIESIKIWTHNSIFISQLRQMLEQVPNLRALSLLTDLDEKPFEKLKPFPVLEKLTDLVLGNDEPLKNDVFDIVKIAPNIQSLDMDCDSERALEVYKRYSNQLKSLAVFFKRNDFFQPFCDIKFAQLEEIDFYTDDFLLTDSLVSQRIETFFQRLVGLKCATLRFSVTETILRIICSNCPDLVELSMKTSNLGEHTRTISLVGLSQLTKLKVLQLDGSVQDDVLVGCKPIPSLQKLVLVRVVMESMLRFFDSLFIVAPQLSSLEVDESDMDVECFLFICDHFSSLERLRLEFCPEIKEGGFMFLNRLPLLRSLELNFLDIDYECFRDTPPNTVRSLKMHRCDKLQIIDPYYFTSIFPSLQELDICGCDLITENDIRLLRASMGQTCCVIFRLMMPGD